MRHIGNCGVAGWSAGTVATVASVSPAPADGAMVTTDVAGLDATVTGFVTAWGLISIVCRPVVGLTSADGRLCNSCMRHSNKCNIDVFIYLGL